MEAIYIPQLLKAPQKTEEIQFQELISGLETLTPVRGRLVITHCGSYIEVSTVAETIVTLVCDRCLQQYNHRLSIDTSELIWLDENAENFDKVPVEREVSLEDLSESLPPNGYFYPEVWLYEQLCLATPVRKLCSQDCQQPAAATAKEPLIDSRWASLADLKGKLSQ